MKNKNEAARVSSMLLDLYSMQRGDDFDLHVLRLLKEYIPSPFTSHSRTCVNTGNMKLAASLGPGMEALSAGDRARADEWSHANPQRQYLIANSIGPLLSISDIMSPREFQKSAFYNELMKPRGVAYNTNIRFYFNGICYSYGVNDAEPLHEEGRRMLLLLRPHLANAFKLYGRPQKKNRTDLSPNVLAVSPDGRVEEYSEEAMLLLKQYYPIGIGGRWTFPQELRSWVGEAVGKSCEGKPQTVDRRSATGPDGTLWLRLQPNASGYFLYLDEVRQDAAAAAFQRWGLSPREADVLRHLVQGSTYSEIAAVLGISPKTVGRHLEKIYRKLGCNNRHAAAQLVKKL